MNFLSMLDTTSAGIWELVRLAQKIKSNPRAYSKSLETKTLIMLFERPSTKTRVSFDIAMNKLAGHALSLDFAQIQSSKKETIADTARALCGYADCIMARLFEQDDLMQLQKYSKTAIINGQTNQEHPCQALADIFTMSEKGKIGHDNVFCYVGNAQKNIANSLIVACAKMGMKVRIACPQQYTPSKKYLDEPKKFSDVQIVHDLKSALKKADVVYTDRWTDFQTEQKNMKNTQLRDYKIDSKMIAFAKKDCIIMHPLPANRDVEISSDCLDCKQSVIWQQSQNRLYVQEALLLKLMEVVAKA